MTTLKDLQKVGCFVPEAPVPRTIVFKGDDGKDYDASVFVKKLGVADYESLFVGGAQSRSHSAMAIHVGIRLGEKGDEVIPYELAMRMDKGLASALMDVFNEVNGPKKS